MNDGKINIYPKNVPVSQNLNFVFFHHFRNEYSLLSTIKIIFEKKRRRVLCSTHPAVFTALITEREQQVSYFIESIKTSLS